MLLLLSSIIVLANELPGTVKNPAQMNGDELAEYANGVYPEYFVCRDAALGAFDAMPVSISSLDATLTALDGCDNAAQADYSLSVTQVTKDRAELEKARKELTHLTSPPLTVYTLARRTDSTTPTKTPSEEAIAIVERAKHEQSSKPVDPAITKAERRLIEAREAIERSAGNLTVASWIVNDAKKRRDTLAEAKAALITSACDKRELDPESVGVTCSIDAATYRVSDTSRPWQTR